MEKTYISYLGVLTTVLCLSGCNTTDSSSRLMMGSEHSDENSFADDSFSSGDEYSDTESEDESHPWFQLERAGGFHERTYTDYTRECIICRSTLWPFKCTNEYIVFPCQECGGIYFLPEGHKESEDYCTRFNGNTLDERNTIAELGCKLFAAGETGWATDDEVEAYDWERNKRAYEAYLQSKNSVLGTPTRQNST